MWRLVPQSSQSFVAEVVAAEAEVVAEVEGAVVGEVAAEAEAEVCHRPSSRLLRFHT